MRALLVIGLAFFLTSVGLLSEAKTTTSAATAAAEWEVFHGEFFEIHYPPSFKPRDGIRRNPASKRPDSAFFESPDGAAEFYVYSPQWNGEPADIEADPSKEKETASKTTRKENTVVREADIRANDGSYERSFLDISNTGLNTRKVFGIRYRDANALKKHRPAYLKFRESLVQLAD